MNKDLIKYYSETLDMSDDMVLEKFGQDTSPLFTIRNTCYVLNRPQMTGDKMSQESIYWRKCRLSSSNIGIPSGRNQFSQADDYFAGKIVGIYQDNFTEYSKDCMMHGILQEPIIREKYSIEIGSDITEIGMAIWKKDIRFSGSLDGEIDQNQGIEIKAPKYRMYKDLMMYVNGKSKGYISDNSRDLEEKKLNHIFESHYDQMICNAVITGKSKMHYVVMHPQTNVLYSDIIDIDIEHWNMLYKNGCHFYDYWIQPLMNQYGIKRLNPLFD